MVKSAKSTRPRATSGCARGRALQLRAAVENAGYIVASEVEYTGHLHRGQDVTAQSLTHK